MDHSYKLNENQFINRHYKNGFYRSSKNIKTKDFSNLEYTPTIWNKNEVIPNNYDWRKNDAVSSIKNQQQCGSCWAFSSTEAVEGAWAIKNKLLFNLSEQELVDCSYYLGNEGCMGGYMTQGFQYVIDHGLCLNESYPYTASSQDCLNTTCTSVVKITNYSLVESNNETILANAVFKQPISVAIQANSQSFQFYSSGIYDDPNCGFDLDHGVLIVGYGYDNTQDIKYWIVKNSWGKSWGENGYIRILRDYKNDTRGICGIAMNASFPII
tara:strand:- start:77 stop:883 length:807 start_codon:yes stop_codon:yes gene_type:complete